MAERGSRAAGVAIALMVMVATVGTAQPMETGWYLILSRESGMAVSVDWSDILLNSANVQQHPYAYAGIQIGIWWIEHVGNNEYKIIQRQSGKAMVVNGNTKDDDGANIKQYTYEPQSAHHRWRIEEVGGGYYRIVSVYSDKCLDLYQSSHADGANIQQWACHGGGNQLWRLDPLLSCRKENEPDGTIAQATYLGILPGELCATGGIDGGIDHYAIDLTHECVVTISTTSKDNGDTVLTLFNETGAEIAFNDDAHGTLQSFIEKCLPAGRYYVQIRGINAQVSFAYELSVSGGEPCSSP